MDSEWDASDFEKKFQELFQQTDADLVTFDNQKGIFITREDFTNYIAKLADISETKKSESIQRQANQLKKRHANMQTQLDDINRMLQKANETERGLMKDLEGTEEALAQSIKESSESKANFENEKKRLLGLIEAQRQKVATLLEKRLPGSDEIIAEQRAKGKALQQELDLLKKEKGEKLSETVVLKMRVASFKAAIQEEGKHQMELRAQFEDALKNQKSIPDIVLDFSEKAAKAVGLYKAMNHFWGKAQSPKEKAWDLIEMARSSDERNKLKSRDLATLAYQVVKMCPPLHRGRYNALLADTARVISLGLRKDVICAIEKWNQEKEKQEGHKEVRELTSITLFDAEDPLASSSGSTSKIVLDKGKKKEDFTNLKPSFFQNFTRRLSNARKRFTCSIGSYWATVRSFKIPLFSKEKPNLSNMTKPSKAKIYWGYAILGFKKAFRIGWNKRCLSSLESDGTLQSHLKPYTPLQASAEWCLAESSGLSYQVVTRLGPVPNPGPMLNKSEWETLRPFMSRDQLELDKAFVERLQSNSMFAKYFASLIDFYHKV